MIGKAKSIAHGVNNIRYITGESEQKKHPERIHNIVNNLMPNFLDARGIWDVMRMQLMSHPKIKNGVIRIELSPQKENTKDFTRDDWKKLWDDFVKEFDKQVLQDKSGKVISPKTSIENSIYTVWLHQDSKSGISHLHAAVCRVDKNGNINNDHNIHERAQKAALRVALKRGWKVPLEVREENMKKVVQDCQDVLKSMPQFHLGIYLKRLGLKYEVKLRRDKNNKILGYSIKKGNTVYKASEIGKGRHFTISNLETTWDRIHKDMIKQDLKTRNKASSSTSATNQKPQEPMRLHYYIDLKDYNTYDSSKTSAQFTYNGKDYHLSLPPEVAKVFREFDHIRMTNAKDLADLAMAIFVGLAGGPPVEYIGSGGGGSSSDDDEEWKRKKLEEEIQWARRCAMYAKETLGVDKRTRGVRFSHMPRRKKRY